MQGNRCRWSFQITHPDQHEPSRTRLNDFIKARAPWFPPVSGEIHWSSMVQLRPAHGQQHGTGPDLARRRLGPPASPVGVQSMNTGLIDAYELAAALAKILRENGSPELLKRYDEASG